jgi:hypothetical protein
MLPTTPSLQALFPFVPLHLFGIDITEKEEEDLRLWLKLNLVKVNDNGNKKSPSDEVVVYETVPLLLDCSDSQQSTSFNDYSDKIPPLAVVMNHIQMRQRGIELRRQTPLPLFYKSLREKENENEKKWEEENDMWRKENENSKKKIKENKGYKTQSDVDEIISLPCTLPPGFTEMKDWLDISDPIEEPSNQIFQDFLGKNSVFSSLLPDSTFFDISMIIFVVNAEVEPNWNESFCLEYTENPSVLIVNEKSNKISYDEMKRQIRKILLMHPDLVSKDLIKSIQSLLFYTLKKGSFSDVIFLSYRYFQSVGSEVRSDDCLGIYDIPAREYIQAHIMNPKEYVKAVYDEADTPEKIIRFFKSFEKKNLFPVKNVGEDVNDFYDRCVKWIKNFGDKNQKLLRKMLSKWKDLEEKKVEGEGEDGKMIEKEKDVVFESENIKKEKNNSICENENVIKDSNRNLRKGASTVRGDEIEQKDMNSSIIDEIGFYDSELNYFNSRRSYEEIFQAVNSSNTVIKPFISNVYPSLTELIYNLLIEHIKTSYLSSSKEKSISANPSSSMTISEPHSSSSSSSSSLQTPPLFIPMPYGERYNQKDSVVPNLEIRKREKETDFENSTEKMIKFISDNRLIHPKYYFLSGDRPNFPRTYSDLVCVSPFDSPDTSQLEIYSSEQLYQRRLLAYDYDPVLLPFHTLFADENKRKKDFSSSVSSPQIGSSSFVCNNDFSDKTHLIFPPFYKENDKSKANFFSLQNSHFPPDECIFSLF